MATVEELEKIIKEQEDRIEDLTRINADQKALIEMYESTQGTPTSTSIIIELNNLKKDEAEKLSQKIRTTEDGITAYQVFNFGISLVEETDSPDTGQRS
jgi:CHASE3 domain sensor protein